MKENTISHARQPAGETLECPTPPPRRILVADDETDVLLLNAEVLKRSGYQVDTAPDGEAAWKALDAASYTSDSYDLLITDHDMPGLTGLDLVKRLRAARMDLPFIMATGTLPAAELARNPWLQPAAMLLKPYTIEELLETVNKVLHAADLECARVSLQPEWHNQPSTVKQPSTVNWRV